MLVNKSQMLNKQGLQVKIKPATTSQYVYSTMARDSRASFDKCVFVAIMYVHVLHVTTCIYAYTARRFNCMCMKPRVLIVVLQERLAILHQPW